MLVVFVVPSTDFDFDRVVVVVAVCDVVWLYFFPHVNTKEFSSMSLHVL